MPILATHGGGDENDAYDVIFSPDIDSTTSPICDDDVIMTSPLAGLEVSTTENDDDNDVDSGAPKKRGPKKQPMTKARLAKVKVLRCTFICTVSLITTVYICINLCASTKVKRCHGVAIRFGVTVDHTGLC